MTPKKLSGADEYSQLQKNITEELDQSNPDEVVRVVISAASSLNYGNTTDPETVTTKTEVTLN